MKKTQIVKTHKIQHSVNVKLTFVRLIYRYKQYGGTSEYLNIHRNIFSSHQLDATRRSWSVCEAWMRSTERRCWSWCCQNQSEDELRLSWWPDCEQRIHLHRREIPEETGVCAKLWQKWTPQNHNKPREISCSQIISNKRIQTSR